MDPTICPHCSKSFFDKSTKLRHMRRVHSVAMETKRKSSHFFCPICPKANKESIASHILLMKHITDAHNIIIEQEKLKFDNWEDFENWKALENRNEKYVIHNKVHKKNIETIYFNCNRSNSKGYESKCMLRKMKCGGSIKIDGICPSRIIAYCRQNGHVTVGFTTTHVGHDIEFKENLPKTVETEYTRDYDDMKAVTAKVREWNSSGKIYAFLFKEIGDTHPKLETTDFALGFMNKAMETKFKNCNRFIWMECVRRITNKNFDLTILIVKDNQDMGFPVAFFLSNREDQATQEVFLEALKERMGEEINAEFFMTDVDEKYYRAWVKIMHNTPKRLLCSWHVRRNWNLTGKKKIKSQVLKNSMDADLGKIMVESNVYKFNNLVNDYFKKLEQENEQNFIKYLKSSYFIDNKIKMWACCFRLDAGINTNTHLETFSKTLRNLGRRDPKMFTVKKLLDTIDELVDENLCTKISNNLKNINIHQAAAQCNINQHVVEAKDIGEFKVESSTDTIDELVEENLCTKISNNLKNILNTHQAAAQCNINQHVEAKDIGEFKVESSTDTIDELVEENLCTKISNNLKNILNTHQAAAQCNINQHVEAKDIGEFKVESSTDTIDELVEENLCTKISNNLKKILYPHQPAGQCNVNQYVEAEDIEKFQVESSTGEDNEESENSFDMDEYVEFKEENYATLNDDENEIMQDNINKDTHRKNVIESWRTSTNYYLDDFCNWDDASFEKLEVYYNSFLKKISEHRSAQRKRETQTYFPHKRQRRE